MLSGDLSLTNGFQVTARLCSTATTRIKTIAFSTNLKPNTQ